MKPYIALFLILVQSIVAETKVRSVIQIWLWGGASSIDTFDPKPNAGTNISGPLTTVVEKNGMTLNGLLPLLSGQSDKFSIIRSLTHGINSHETAAYIMQTGHPAGERDVYPSIGAVVAMLNAQNYNGLIPPYVILTETQGRFSETGFLGQKYKPFATGGDPSKVPFAVEGVVAKGVTKAQQEQRRELLHKLDTLSLTMPNDPRIVDAKKSEQQAYELILGDAGKVFDVTTESQQVRNAYGKSSFGQSCLVARRLVEVGVPYVTINYKGWDTHKQHFNRMRQMLPDLDQGLSQLLKELAEKGLLDSTIVWCCGEFGRTPQVQWEPPWNGGRGHYGNAFSVLIAGGGFKGGRVVGTTNETGETVVTRPVSPQELLGSIYRQLGIDATRTLPHPEGKQVKILELKPEAKLLDELLN